MKAFDGLRQVRVFRPMQPRDPAERHRAASVLELFFDLCFVVAVAQAATGLHHGMLEGHVQGALLGYATVFFSIWWAWMNFTWFASAYDNDDVPYRLATLVQILGTLVLAAGIGDAFEAQNYDIVFAGYAIMRLALVYQWLRAATHDPARRTTAIRYAIGVTLAMFGWASMLLLDVWPLWAWWLMAAIELLVPVIAERASPTPWHAEHIAERYGLFTIIVLGESITAATNAVQQVITASGATIDLLAICLGGLLTVFSLWWLYFSKPAHAYLTSNRTAFVWGYGHYLILASAAAVGAGLAVNVDYMSESHAEIGHVLAAASVTVPTALFLGMVALLHLRPHLARASESLGFCIAVAAILAATFTPWPIVSCGLIAALLVTHLVRQQSKRYSTASGDT